MAEQGFSQCEKTLHIVRHSSLARWLCSIWCQKYNSLAFLGNQGIITDIYWYWYRIHNTGIIDITLVSCHQDILSHSLSGIQFINIGILPISGNVDEILILWNPFWLWVANIQEFDFLIFGHADEFLISCGDLPVTIIRFTDARNAAELLISATAMMFEYQISIYWYREM